MLILLWNGNCCTFGQVFYPYIWMVALEGLPIGWEGGSVGILPLSISLESPRMLFAQGVKRGVSTLIITAAKVVIFHSKL